MNEIITVEAGENSLPAAARAIQITERIRANGRTAVNAVCAIGKDLRTMKIDKLYTELGYAEFEDYAEKEFQLKRRQTYQYISVFEKLGEEFVQSNAQLGITKLALLAMANPEDRAEVMESENVHDMTTRELEELLANYKQQGEQLSLIQEEKTKLEAKVEELEKTTNDRLRKEMNSEIKEKVKKEVEAETKKQAKELKQKETELQNARALKEKVEQEKKELEKRISELEQAANKPPENADKSNFKVLLSTVYRDMLGLVEFIKDTEDIEERKQYFRKALEILHVCEDSIKKVDLPVDIPKEHLTSRGIVDINSIPPISSSDGEEEVDDE